MIFQDDFKENSFPTIYKSTQTSFDNRNPTNYSNFWYNLTLMVTIRVGIFFVNT